MLPIVPIADLLVILPEKEEIITVIGGIYINVTMVIDMMSLVPVPAVLLGKEVIVHIAEPQLILQEKGEIITVIGGMYMNVLMDIDIACLANNAAWK